jgi:hypothetical protein
MSRIFYRAGMSLTLLILTACSNMNNSDQRVLSGTAIGAAAGTVGALIVQGNPILGLVGGAAVGAVTGYAIDKHDAKSNQ